MDIYVVSSSIELVDGTNRDLFELCNVKVHGTFATAGSDGAFNFWDKDSKQRLKVLSCCIFAFH